MPNTRRQVHPIILSLLNKSWNNELNKYLINNNLSKCFENSASNVYVTNHKLCHSNMAYWELWLSSWVNMQNVRQILYKAWGKKHSRLASLNYSPELCWSLLEWKYEGWNTNQENHYHNDKCNSAEADTSAYVLSFL